MGLSSGLADAAKTLKRDVDDGVDLRKALSNFADKVERVATESGEAFKKARKDSTNK